MINGYNLNLCKKDNYYFESFKYGKNEEKYVYAQGNDFIQLKDYDSYLREQKDESGERNSKRKNIDKKYSKNILLGTEIFEAFEGDSIPKKLSVLMGSDVYNSKLREEEIKRIKSDLIRVKYDWIDYPEKEDDKFKTNELIEVYLKEENDGTYYPIGAKINVERNFLIKFNIHIWEKDYVGD